MQLILENKDTCKEREEFENKETELIMLINHNNC